MSEYVYAGLTLQTIDIFLQDSSSATGEGLAGLVYNTAGLVASYRKGATGSRTAITLATQTVGGAFSSGGFVEIEATHMKGVYRIDLPNAAVDTEGFVTLFLYGATNLLPTALRIDCRPLPVDIKKLLGTAWLTPGTAGTPDVNAKLIGATSQTGSDVGAKVNALTKGLIAGVVASSSSTTVVNVTSTESGLAVTDQLKGRVIIFNKDTTTAALRGQGAPIDTNDTTSITVASGDAFTTAPASGDTFTIY